jgi:PAS domain S-box-containing protein
LVLEDDASAVELVRAMLAADGLACDVVHADDERSFTDALRAGPPDLILADYNLPTIDGMTALEIRNRSCPETPFILVSGAVGEMMAIDLLKSGLTDFVLKDQLARLVPAIRRSLAEAHEHRVRMQAEQSLRDSEARFRRLAENAPDVIFRYQFAAGRWRCEYVNATVTRLTGYRPEEFYGSSLLPLKLVHPEDRAVLHGLLQNRTLPAAAAEIRWVTRDARIIITEQRFVPVLGPEGNWVAVEGIARDVTAAREEQSRRRMLELQLNQAQKMESIGALAGGIAHDFNNILTGILGFTELAQIESGNPQRVKDSLAEVRQAGLRAKELVAQILTFCRQQQTKEVPLDISRIVGEALKFLRASTPATIEIERRLSSCVILGDPTQIHQVVLNLCTNALHAMRSRKGRLSVWVERCEVDAALAATMPKVQPGAFARLTVQDTGHGMEEAMLTRIFDPFFTTKAVGEGTGLGLSVVQGIVSAARGGIAVESTVGKGTTFRLYFPICAQPTAARVEAPAVKPGNGEQILVIDDENSVSAFMGVRLQQLQYRPAVFTDPRRALAAMTAAPHRFAAIVTDLTMPGLTGVDLIREARRVAPHLPAVIVTGNRSELTSVEDLAPIEVLSKPFSGDDLGAVLNRLLPAPAPSP